MSTREPVTLSSLPAEVVAECHRYLLERLGIDTGADPDPLIDLKDIAAFAGLSVKTPSMWRQRTRNGQAAHPFPEPGDPAGKRYPDKPMWRAVTEVYPYLEETGNWPPESGARPTTRGPRPEVRRARQPRAAAA